MTGPSTARGPSASRRLVHVVTVAESLRFLRGQPAFMRGRDWETHVVAAPSALLDRFAREEGVVAHPVRMERVISPARDARALGSLVALLRALEPSIVHAHTPKGGLLGVLAGRIARVPRVLYHMRGLPFVGQEGRRRALLLGTERVSCRLAHRVLCQSESLRQVALEHRLASADNLTVLGPGGNGVDARHRFDPTRVPPAEVTSLRARLGLPEGAPVIGFVGRLVGDKGIRELTRAWSELREAFPAAHMVLVGPFEPRDPVPEDTRRALLSDPRVHLAGETEEVAPYYKLIDVLALPSYREGFPNVPVEAAAMQVPVVATRIGGCVEAVVDGHTGRLVPARDYAALRDALATYLESPELRRAHGRAGRERALRELSRERIWQLLAGVYEERAS